MKKTAKMQYGLKGRIDPSFKFVEKVINKEGVEE
jgi:hypothetical protein